MKDINFLSCWDFKDFLKFYFDFYELSSFKNIKKY